MAGPPVYNEKKPVGKEVRQLFAKSDLTFTLEGNSYNFEQAISLMKQQFQPSARAKLFPAFLFQAAQYYRLKENKKNSFGLAYRTEAADATTVTKMGEGNCLSFNLSFIAFALTVANELKLDATGNLKEVIRVGSSDFAGHVIGAIKLPSSPTFFFDMTNSAKDINFKGFSQNKSDPTVVYGPGNFRYDLGANIAVNDIVFEATKLQYKLSTGLSLSKSDINLLVVIPPTMLTYLIDSLIANSPSNLTAISQTIWENRETEDPNVLLRLCLTISNHFMNVNDMGAANTFAKLAAESLDSLVAAGRTGELKLTPFLPQFARCFTMLVESKDEAAFVLYRAMITTIGMADINALIHDLKKQDQKSQKEFLSTIHKAFSTAKSLIDYDLNNPFGLKVQLLESLALIRFSHTISGLRISNNPYVKLIVVDTKDWLTANYSSLKLDYNKLA
ncbi:hypothetical protein HYT84_04600, partial [Candidatus Micrarchaeota archaeon]|nr:hypothetical protein [Candidatus Micrarchaeota archaeon]